MTREVNTIYFPCNIVSKYDVHWYISGKNLDGEICDKQSGHEKETLFV